MSEETADTGLGLHERITALMAEVETYSKTNLAYTLAVDTVLAKGLLFGQDRARADLLRHLDEGKTLAATINKNRRYRNGTHRIAQLLRRGADCNVCYDWRPRGAKKKGTRIPGGKGKCTRPEGHCDPSEVRK